MKKVFALLVVFEFAAWNLSAQEISTAPSPADYEKLPDLKASEILRPEFLQGPHFKVRENVPTQSGCNHFTIESDFGAFEAEGNAMLVRRVGEINAIARLKEISRTDEFKNALVKAAKSPVAAAKAIVTDPVHAITNVPKGIMRFMGHIGETAKGIGEKHQGKDPEGTQLQQIIGFSDAKRKLAIKLGVDPYSSNTVLQHELDGIAWAAFAGGGTFSLATMPISGTAATVLSVTEKSADLNAMLADQSPADLKMMNRKALLAMGADQRDAERFLNNNTFSPTAQTAFVLNLDSMKNVGNRGAFVRLAGETSASEADAIFCVQTAALLRKIDKEEKPLARIITFGDFPAAIAKDGTTVVALQWDYAAWTASAARFSKQLRSFANKPPANKKVFVAVSGQVSPLLRQQTASLGDQLKYQFSSGPLR